MEFRITKNSLIAFVIAFVFVFFATLAHAQTPSPASDQQVAQKYKISFPVVELGNCNSLTECKTYCADPNNQTACVSFAKSHGFYKPPTTTASDDSIVQAAKTELGCDSKSACQQFCGLQENWQKCGDFARKHRLPGAPPTASVSGQPSQDILQKAGQFLGCTSYDSCKAICSQVENRDKCSEFARMVNLPGGQKPQTPPMDLQHSSTSGKPLPPINADICKGLSEKLASNSTLTQDAKAMYLKYCQQGVNQGPSTISGTQQLDRPVPLSRSTRPGTQIPPHTGVQGVSTGPGFLQTVLSWLGF